MVRRDGLEDHPSRPSRRTIEGKQSDIKRSSTVSKIVIINIICKKTRQQCVEYTHIITVVDADLL